jgi:hypothetical protein
MYAFKILIVLSFVSATVTAVSAQPTARQVESNAALKALTAGPHGFVERLGFRFAGDGGDALYTWSNAACSLNAGAGDDGLQVKPTTGVGCWSAAIAGKAVTPLLWGAVGSATSPSPTADTSAMKAAIIGAALAGATLRFDTAHLYAIDATLDVSAPLKIEGPFRYGVWTTSARNEGRACPWGITATMNATLFNWTAVTGAITGVCLQLAPKGTSATAGAAIQFAPPSTATYQSGVTATYNTILGAYDAITLDGAGHSPGCCGQGATADGNLIGWNSITDPGDAGISIGKNTANAASVGNTLIDNAITCINAISHASAYGVVIYDGGASYDGSQNGPLGCHIGVAIIPGAVAGVGQNAQLSPATGVLGDQSGLYGLLVQPQTSLGMAAFLQCHQCWAASGSATSAPVMISNTKGGSIDGAAFVGGNFHSGANASVPVFDIEGGSSGRLQNIVLQGTQIVCWGGGACTAPLLKINGIASNRPRDISIVGGQIGMSTEAGTSPCATGVSVSGPGVAYITLADTVGLEACSTPLAVSGNAVNAASGLYVSNNVGIVPVNAQFNPSDPPGTSSTTGVMAGLNVNVTPRTSGIFTVTSYGNMGSDAAGGGVAVELRYGTGAPPIPGASRAGESCANGSVSGLSPVGGQTVPFSMTCVLPALSIGTSYWFDLYYRAISGRAAHATNNVVTVTER